MRKYLVKLMFNINMDEGNHVSQFDEQVRLIESQNAVEAFHKARALGKNEEETFVNQENQLVNWKFIDVVDIYTLENKKDGAQIFSHTHNIVDVDSYIKYIRQKAMEIQVKNLTFA